MKVTVILTVHSPKNEDLFSLDTEVKRGYTRLIDLPNHLDIRGRRPMIVIVSKEKAPTKRG